MNLFVGLLMELLFLCAALLPCIGAFIYFRAQAKRRWYVEGLIILLLFSISLPFWMNLAIVVSTSSSSHPKVEDFEHGKEDLSRDE